MTRPKPRVSKSPESSLEPDSIHTLLADLHLGISDEGLEPVGPADTFPTIEQTTDARELQNHGFNPTIRAVSAIEPALFTACQEQGIDIASVPPSKITMFALTAGKVIAEHVVDARQSYREQFPEADIHKGPMLVPGNVAYGISAVTKITDDIHSASTFARRRAMEHQAALIDYALSEGTTFPEIVIASDLEESLLDKDSDTAAEGVGILLASYGQRILNISSAARQRASRFDEQYTRAVVQPLHVNPRYV